MSIKSKVLRWARFARTVWDNRWLCDALADRDNLRYIRLAPPGHFYSPLLDIREVNAQAERLFEKAVRGVPGINLNQEKQFQLLQEFAALYNECPFPETHASGTRYFLDNEYFSYGDGIALYSFLRYCRPTRIIEIGSGFSSAAMLDVNDRFFGGSIKCTFIEPYPERLQRLMTANDKMRHTVLKKKVQDVDLEIFDTLKENDILFVDSSHVAKTGSDVFHIFSNILPRLRQGVFIHFHDITWPFEYPRNWVETGMSWNEAYFLKAFLQYNSIFQIVYFSAFIEAVGKDLMAKAMPLALKTATQTSPLVTPSNSSIWLRKMPA
jgi:predicted O-methyltransferase YrrM